MAGKSSRCIVVGRKVVYRLTVMPERTPGNRPIDCLRKCWVEVITGSARDAIVLLESSRCRTIGFVSPQVPLPCQDRGITCLFENLSQCDHVGPQQTGLAKSGIEPGHHGESAYSADSVVIKLREANS